MRNVRRRDRPQATRNGCGQTRRGFTLIELVVTLAILAVLGLIAMPVAELAYKRTKEQELRYNLRQIRDAIDAYKRAWDEGRIPKKVDETGYPPSLDVLVQGVEDLRSPTKAKIYFMRRIPPDPMAPAGADGSSGGRSPSDALRSDQWGKRSYASPPEEPKPGADVYDVFSLSQGVGINGVPYKEW